ncbi:transmembrane 6 superfamily member 2-like [Hoplias malabaricus]|uniref:transmembrane 6 superfamily member 2-like n=1 Tax=Hoplias malabaricus TaxID=27720 RepID=UPI00346291EE
MELPLEIRVFVLSMTAPFVLYAVNNFSSLLTPLLILGIEGAILITVFFMAYLCVRNEKTVDPLFYVFAVFSFTSVADLTTALEQDGYIKGFIAFYINKGEPYLNTAYCIMMNYWNGVVHFVLLLAAVRCMRKGTPYRRIGLLWAGSVITTHIVFIPGVIIGKHGKSIYPAFWNNILSLILSVCAALQLYNRPRDLPIIPADKVAEEQKKGLLSRPRELFLTLCLLGAMAFTVFRGFVVLECALDICFTYIYQYEPYLKDNVAFPKVMMLVVLFYALPMLMACIYGLNIPGCTWMLDWTLLLAGALAQTQWAHIGASVHSRTPFTYRIPKDEWRLVMTLNMLFMAVPLLLALHIYRQPAFFMKTVKPGHTDNDKKRK